MREPPSLPPARRRVRRRGSVRLLGGTARRTAVDKQPTVGAVEVTRAGVTGDEQADRSRHGGPDQAL